MLIIDSTLVKSPTELSVGIMQIDSEASKRGSAGLMNRHRIAIKRTIKGKWNYLTNAESITLLTAVSDSEFTIQYPDPWLGVTTKTFYVGDTQNQLYSYDTLTAKWVNVTMNFIEI